VNAPQDIIYPELYTKLTWPVIIMRHGGLDGVALQKEEYFSLLKKHDMDIHVISGREETEYGAMETEDQARSLVERLDFYHPDSLLLFANQFTHGPEKEGIDKIDDEEWLRLFHAHKDAIRDEIDQILAGIPNNTPIFVYNLLSLRHAHPAAAVAIRELMDKYQDRGFLSHAADPDAERPEKISRIKEFALRVISANDPSEPYSGGPYTRNNLYHIVLNPTQYYNFTTKYGVSERHAYEIPDFLGFKSKKAVAVEEPEKGFLDYLAENGVHVSDETYEYRRTDLTEDMIYFLSPVRPVYRKRLIEAMMVAHEYGRTRGKKIVFVVTHPNVDDRHYFLKTAAFAHDLGMRFIHLGRDFTLETLDRVYANMAPLNTVGVVASSAGGWENALNEMASTCIPFIMSSTLNSYDPLTKEIGIVTQGLDFGVLEDMVERVPADELRGRNLSNLPGMRETLKWIDGALSDESRRMLTEHNYEQAYRFLSHEATALRLWEAILKIYARHGLPGQPGQGVED